MSTLARSASKWDLTQDMDQISACLAEGIDSLKTIWRAPTSARNLLFVGERTFTPPLLALRASVRIAYNHPMPNVFLLSNDLMTTSRIQGAAVGAGVNVILAMNVDALRERLTSATDEKKPLIVVDLQTHGIDWADALRELTTLGRVLAFGPHVWKEQLDLARQTGCDFVLTNGEFYSQMSRWLSDPT